jgi:hypothetical protein
LAGVVKAIELTIDESLVNFIESELRSEKLSASMRIFFDKLLAISRSSCGKVLRSN